MLDRCVNRQHLRPRRDRLGEGVDVVLHARVRVLLRHDDHREAEALGLLVPRREVARVVVLEARMHLVAGLEVEAVRHHVVRLAGVAGDDDLFGRDAQERGERLARASPSRGISRARLLGDGSRSTLSRLARAALRAPGREAGQRLAAFITARSGGITNCSRTLFQNASPRGGAAGASAPAGAPAGPRRVAEERRGAADGKQPVQSVVVRLTWAWVGDLYRVSGLSSTLPCLLSHPAATDAGSPTRPCSSLSQASRGRRSSSAGPPCLGPRLPSTACSLPRSSLSRGASSRLSCRAASAAAS